MTRETVITAAMRAAIGVESESRTYLVEAGAISRFAEAIGDPNPIFSDEEADGRTRYGGIIAPPTFLRSLGSGPLKVEIDVPYSGLLDGGSEWEYFQPVRPGDRITVTTNVADLFERQSKLGNTVFIVIESRYVDQLGQLVATERNTLVRYEPGAAGP